MYVSGVCYYLSSTINPILYNLMSVKYRQAFRRTLCGIQSTLHLEGPNAGISKEIQRYYMWYWTFLIFPGGANMPHQFRGRASTWDNEQGQRRHSTANGGPPGSRKQSAAGRTAAATAAAAAARADRCRKGSAASAVLYDVRDPHR